MNGMNSLNSRAMLVVACLAAVLAVPASAEIRSVTFKTSNRAVAYL